MPLWQLWIEIYGEIYPFFRNYRGPHCLLGNAKVAQESSCMARSGTISYWRNWVIRIWRISVVTTSKRISKWDMLEVVLGIPLDHSQRWLLHWRHYSMPMVQRYFLVSRTSQEYCPVNSHHHIKCGKWRIHPTKMTWACLKVGVPPNVMWLKQFHKPSPSHHHFYRWYGYHSQFPVMGGLWHCFTHSTLW